MGRFAFFGSALFVIGCGNYLPDAAGTPDASVGNPGDAAMPGGDLSSTGGTVDLRQPAPDLAPFVDPCLKASIATGYETDCGSFLGGEPNTVYHCWNRQTVWTTACPVGCQNGGTNASDYCIAPPSPPAPKGNGGKGLWIWDMTVAGHPSGHAPDPQTIANLCKQLGVGFVLIKSGEDDSFWSWNFNTATVTPFLDSGIEVYAWPYVRNGSSTLTPGAPPFFGTTADHVTQTLMAAAVKSTGGKSINGIILDVEEEFKRTFPSTMDPTINPGHLPLKDPHTTFGADATALCKGIRAGLPADGSIKLGYTTFGWVYKNTSFPFAEFDADCGDMFLPQIYYSDYSSASSFTMQQLYDLGCGANNDPHGLNLHAPCWAIDENEGGLGSATTTQLQDFFTVAGGRASLWRLFGPTDGAAQTTYNSQIMQINNWKNP